MSFQRAAAVRHDPASMPHPPRPSAPPQAHPDDEGLTRGLGFVDVFALAVGGAIGFGIFLIPGGATARLGPASLLAFAVAGVAAMLVALCFAEAGSRFRGTGGPMVYAQTAFGDAAAFGAGWAIWVSRVSSWATLANGFVTASSSLVAMLGVTSDDVVVRTVVGYATMIALFALLMAANLAGTLAGGRTNTIVTALKVVTLLAFVLGGLAFVDLARFEPFAPLGFDDFGGTTVYVFYAYVGFEGLVIPAAEMRRPDVDVPRGLLWGIATVVLLYMAVVFVCIGTFPGLAESGNAVGDAASTFLGPVGAIAVQCGIVLSVFGINAYMAFIAPRALYGLGRAGLMPRWFGAISARSVPARAVLVTTAITLALAVTGTFEQLAVISVVARLGLYVLTCLATMRLRTREDVPPARFRMPGGPTVPLLTILVCIALALAADRGELAAGAGLLLVGYPAYGATRWFARAER
jgi:APA family basic amino acid/polyamine antiporter